MLVHDQGDRWTIIGQPAHAWLASQLAQAWAPRPADDVLLAIAQHDVVWSDYDREPPLDREARRAAAFMETPPDVRLELWSSAASRLVAQSPYAALLVSMHATNIYTRYGDPSRRPTTFLEARAAEQHALLERLAAAGATAEQALADADLLFCLDAMSLALCMGSSEATLPAVGERAAATLVVPGDGEAVVDPWPFAVDEVHVGVHARSFTERFDDEAALHAALDAAPWEWRSWQLRPTG